MLQLRKSYFCGISVIFFQCCFMSETQVLMSFPIFRFSGFCSRNNFLEGGFTFQCGDVFFSWEEASFLSEGVLHGNGIGFDGGGLQKNNNRMGGGGVPCCVFVQVLLLALLMMCCMRFLQVI